MNPEISREFTLPCGKVVLTQPPEIVSLTHFKEITHLVYPREVFAYNRQWDSNYELPKVTFIDKILYRKIIDRSYYK